VEDISWMVSQGDSKIWMSGSKTCSKMSISDLLFTSNARKQNLREGYSNVGKQVEEPMIMKNQSLKD
jgi:hypothetical protein